MTQNLGKVSEFKRIGVKVNHISMDYAELRSDDPCDIVEEAVCKLANKLGKPIVAEDSGLFIKSFNGFPGTCSAYVHRRLGLKGILKIMDGVNDRSCEYRSAVGYCMPGGKSISFLGIEQGLISDKIRGSHGFGHDPIFIPIGSDKTYGEMPNVEDIKKFRRIAVLKLMDYLK